MAGHDGVVFEILVSKMCSTYRNRRETMYHTTALLAQNTYHIS